VASFIHSTTVMTSNLPGPVVKRLAVAALLLAALSFGCGKPERGPDKAAKASPGVSVDRSVGLPDEFPKDVPILKNATLNATISQGDRMIVQLHTTASIREAENFYRTALKKEGWTVAEPSDSGDMTIVSAKKGNTLCSVTFARDGKGTDIRLAISPVRTAGQNKSSAVDAGQQKRE
jgi:hypothetical protein